MTTAPGVAALLRPPLAVSRVGSNRLSYQIRWPTIINRSTTRALVLDIQAKSAERCAVEAWIEVGETREVLVSQSVLPCAITNDGGMIHLDVHRQGERVLSMTVRGSDEQLLYCRTDLLAKAGFAGGRYDPPRGGTTDEPG